MALSTAAKAAIAAQRSTKALINFITISHPDFALTLYFCDNTANITRNGQVYTAYNFDCKLPDDCEDRMPAISLTIQNISREMVTQIRSVSAGKQLSIQINEALADTPDTTERGPFDFIIRSIKTDQIYCTAEMSFEDILNDPYPKDLMSGNNFPGLVS